MDISKRFSLEDFLAYFFPGLTGILGIYVLLLLTPLRDNLLKSVDVITGILILILSYIVGILLSCFAEPAVKAYGRFSRKARPRESIPLSEYKETIQEAYKEFFDIPRNGEEFVWTGSCFYLCRSLVLAYMPNMSSVIQRQNGLRQLRMNMIPSLVIWLAAGVLWGWHMLDQNSMYFGVLLIILSVVLFLVVGYFIINRMYSNEEREAREVVSAFIIGYKTGKFDPKKRDSFKTEEGQTTTKDGKNNDKDRPTT